MRVSLAPFGAGNFHGHAAGDDVLREFGRRLRENIRQGRTLYRIRASFDLVTIDKGLEELKARLKDVTEERDILKKALAYFADDQK